MKNVHINNQIIIYETEDGKARVEVRFEDENVWLSQKLIAQLFESSIDNVSLHLKNIFAEGELDPKSVIEEYSITAADGKKYKTKHYNHSGSVSAIDAEIKAEAEFIKYKKEEDNKYISDFDKEIKRYLKSGAGRRK